jgi:hypothetical protein
MWLMMTLKKHEKENQGSGEEFGRNKGNRSWKEICHC